MRFIKTSTACFLWIIRPDVCDGLSNPASSTKENGRSLNLRNTNRHRESFAKIPGTRDIALSMKPLKDRNPTAGAKNTRLRFRNLLHDEEEIVQYDWVDKWMAENLPGYFAGKKAKGKSADGKVKKKIHIERDEELEGSIITHIINEGALQDIEELPHKAPMIFDSDTIRRFNKDEQISTTINGETQARNEKMKESRHLKNLLEVEKVSDDQAELALSVASTIETPEQWIEFCENVGGLKPILQFIHSVAEEIKSGRPNEKDGIHLLKPDDVDRFSTACSSCKTLRDLCAKDQYWASAITDEILALNESGTIVSDLVLLLKHANEAERISSRKAWRRRRRLRKKSIYSTVRKTRTQRRDSKRRCRLYINQLLLVMALASDDAIDVFRNTPGLLETVRSFSSYSRQQKIRRRWIKYPLEVTKRMFNKTVRKEYKESSQTAFVAAGSMKSGIIGEIQATSNKLLGALGHNPFIPKTPGQRGLRILSLDGGGTRGVVSIGAMKSIVDSLDGMEVCDSFDMIAGTSTGAIIAFLVGLKRESNEQAKKRYDELIKKIFVKSRLSKAMLLLTTATYSETPFKSILQDVLGDYSMLDTRADPRVPLVLAVSSQMSSTHSKVALFRNYNYAESAKADKFVVSPAEARQKLGFPAENCVQKYGTASSSKEVGSTSRHEGSFRILQRAAIRATTAAPTIFKPVQLGSDMYSDGGLVASNPTAIAISEARTLFPDVPIEMVVSVGTGDFVNEKVTPSFGWDGIISQIIKSATDTEKIHWVLKDILGQGTTSNPGSPVCNTKYFRFDPVVGKKGEFPLDGTDPIALEKLYKITNEYMNQPEQQKSLREIARVIKGTRFF